MLSLACICQGRMNNEADEMRLKPAAHPKQMLWMSLIEAGNFTEFLRGDRGGEGGEQSEGCGTGWDGERDCASGSN